MTKVQIILTVIREGREWIKILLPPFIAWHLKAPNWGKKREEG